MRTVFLGVILVSGPSLWAQGYGQNAGGTSGFGTGSGNGGASLARVAVAPGAFTGTGGVGAGLAGGAQGLGGSGGGGLHGVTRWTPMAEPNAIAGQFFGAGGINLPGGTGAALGASRTGAYGLVRSTNPADRRRLQQGRFAPAEVVRGSSTDSRAMTAFGNTLSAVQARDPSQGVRDAEKATAKDGAKAVLSPAQMAGVQPSAPTPEQP